MHSNTSWTIIYKFQLGKTSTTYPSPDRTVRLCAYFHVQGLRKGDVKVCENSFAAGTT